MATPTRQTERHSPKYTSPSFESHDDTTISTAYNGAEGEIQRRSLQALDEDFGYDELHSVTPNKAPSSPRQAIGARFLSSLSNATQSGAGGGALGRSKSVIHSRAKSLVAAYAPKLNQDGAPSPERAGTPGNRNSGFFGDFFSGESAPVRLGVAPPQQSESDEFCMEYQPSFTELPSMRRKPAVKTTNAPKRTSNAGGGWFGRKTMAVSSIAENDELVNVNINNSLFPHGPADALSPHAFNDLLLNATELLERMQTAYKEKVNYIASIQPEIDVQKEEVEEAETRARHLKMQLEDISRKKSEQEVAMREMALQLAEEKIKVSEAREALQKANRSANDGDNEETPRRRKRNSDGTSNASDSGFESDIDYAESFMSNGLEPTSQPMQAFRPDLNRLDSRQSSSTDLPRQSSVSGRSGSRLAALERKRIGNDVGASQRLQEENRNLHKQLEIMQRQLQGCIDFVGGVTV